MYCLGNSGSIYHGQTFKKDHFVDGAEKYIVTSDGKINIKNLTAIMHPIESMYREIEVRGEKFIPVIRIAQEFFPHIASWHTGVPKDQDFEFCMNEDEDQFFNYSDGFMMYDYFSEVPMNDHWKMYERLDEWMIDYRGLIDRGVAISVYELDTCDNPYVY
jgi:hypothetical protein